MFSIFIYFIEAGHQSVVSYLSQYFGLLGFIFSGLEQVAGLLLGSKLKKKIAQPFESKLV